MEGPAGHAPRTRGRLTWYFFGATWEEKKNEMGSARYRAVIGHKSWTEEVGKHL